MTRMSEPYGLTVTLTDTGTFEEWGFWKKLRIYLSPSRCGHKHGWPKSPAETVREAAQKMADALRRTEDARSPAPPATYHPDMP